jgi:hypothetical protein
VSDRQITILLREGVSPEDYARLANALWSVADLAGDDFIGVQPDGQADGSFLNDWWEKEAGSARWP